METDNHNPKPEPDDASNFRNPSPPPGYLDMVAEKPDVIKNAGIMKTSVFSILLELIKEVESQRQEEGEEEVDVSEEKQNQFSMLWDMSMDPDVARFLLEKECNAVPILINAIHKSRAPRINEICIGILGNMCCVPEICEGLTQYEGFMPLMCSLLGHIEFDPPTLRESLRLVQQCVAIEAVSQVWLQALRHTPDVLDLILFVLQSGVDCSLLRAAGELLDTVLDACDDLCEEWAIPALVDSLLTALRQIGVGEMDTVISFLHILQLLSTSQAGVQALVEHGKEVVRVLGIFLHQMCDEDILYVREHLSCLSSILSVLCLLLTSVPAVARLLSTRPRLFKDLMAVLESLYNVYGSQRPHDPTAPPACILRLRQAQHPDQAHRVHRRSSEESPVCTDAPAATTECPSQALAVGKGSLRETSDPDKPHVTSFRNSDVGGSDSVGVTWSESEEEESMAEVDSDGERLRVLYDCLQEYFRFFFASVVTEEDGLTKPNLEEDGKKTPDKTEPSFVPILKQLGHCHRKQITYLVSALLYDLSDRDNSDLTHHGNRSEEGSKGVQHLMDVCKALGFPRTAGVVKEAMQNVERTAGWGDAG